VPVRPAAGIGGYSLDLMRATGASIRTVSSTSPCVDHRTSAGGGYKGLSLNFAALRSVLDGENGDGVTQRVERWALKKMSSFLQIETLWRFNAKYEPQWMPRYVRLRHGEHLVPVVLAILRAESLSEVPVIGRFDRRLRPSGPRPRCGRRLRRLAAAGSRRVRRRRADVV